MFTVFKDKDTGKYRWVTRSSNAYKDRDSEIVSLKALTDDVDNSDKTGDYGTLRVWHMPGADIGDCDFRMMEGKTLVESGTFKNERIAKALSESADKFQVSIGFNHPQDEPKNGVFYTIKTFERSLVPAGKAANPFTSLQVMSAKERKNAMDHTKKVAEFKSLLPDEGAVDEFLTNVKASEKQADGMGIAFKGFDWNKLSSSARLELAIQDVELQALKEAGSNSEVIPDVAIELNTTIEVSEPDTTTKAKKKMPKVEVEIEEEDDMEDDEDMDMEDEEMSMKADSEYMTEIMSKAFSPMLTELKGFFQDMMKKRDGEAKGKTEKQANDIQTVVEVTDAHTERIALLEQTVKELKDTLTKANEALNATTKELSALTGNQPAINKSALVEMQSQKDFLGLPALGSNGRPTQSTSNVVATNAPASEEAYKQLNTPFLPSFISEIMSDGQNGHK